MGQMDGQGLLGGQQLPSQENHRLELVDQILQEERLSLRQELSGKNQE